jgi:hypothetical protein
MEQLYTLGVFKSHQHHGEILTKKENSVTCDRIPDFTAQLYTLGVFRVHHHHGEI